MRIFDTQYLVEIPNSIVNNKNKLNIGLNNC